MSQIQNSKQVSIQIPQTEPNKFLTFIHSNLGIVSKFGFRASNLLVSGLIFLFFGSSFAYAQGVTCDTIEYACWGRNVPIKDIRCDEVWEREICSKPICGTGCCPDDDPLTTDDESDCICCCTQYSCRLCLEGKIFPYPERPEGGHGAADKCPTEDDLGQKDGTGYVDGDDKYPWFDYDRPAEQPIVQVPPILFHPYSPPSSPTPTIPYATATPPPEGPVPSLTPIGTPVPATPTPGGPPTSTPTTGPTVTPTATPTGSPTPTPDLNAPCGWPVGSRDLGFVCSEGDKPVDGVGGTGSHGYESTDIIAQDGAGITSTQAGTAYRCVNTIEENVPGCDDDPSTPEPVCNVGTGTSYGVYVIVIGSNDWKTLYAHLEPQLPQDNGGAPGYPCLSGDRLVKTFSVGEGSSVGSVGMTGGSNWPHLHYEIWQGDIQNPIPRLCPAAFMDGRVCGWIDWNAQGPFDVLNNTVATIVDWLRSFLRAINPFGSVLAQS